MASPKKVLIIVENLPVPFDRRVWMEATTLQKAGYEVNLPVMALIKITKLLSRFTFTVILYQRKKVLSLVISESTVGRLTGNFV
jgi:hypothetical protein